MNRPLLASAIVGWLGVAIVLTQTRWVARLSLTSRLRPYAIGRPIDERHPAYRRRPLRDALAPASAAFGERFARVLGATESAAIRLARIHASTDPAAFRLRQAAWAAVALVASASVAALSGAGPSAGLLLLATGPVLVFALLEKGLTDRSRAWQHRLAAEVPLVAEQIGMLLSSGWSLGAALGRVADRGQGACAHDLSRVVGRVRQGLDQTAALREWADLAGVDGVDRLVAVLALNRETTELGRIISDEARALRRDAHRRLIEIIERRSQQVWIPVTVAALVPGVILLAIPFIEALRLFTAP